MGKIPDTIVQASDHTAHLVLLALCRKSTSVAENAEHVLNKLAARDKAAAKRAGDEVPLVCWTCGVYYFEEENYDTACQFHDGELEETEDSYPDTDPWMLEGRTEDELQEEFPSEYWWTCCGKQGSEDESLGRSVTLREGCVIRRHMTEEEAGNGSVSSSSSSSSSSSNSKRPATTEIYDGSVKRLAVAAPTAASVLPPSGIKVTPVPVPVLAPAYGSRVTPIPPPVLPPTAAGIPVQPTVITLSDEEDEEGGDDEEGVDE